MRADYIWMNEEMVPWDRAQVHPLTHALHYGSSVFESMRADEIFFTGTAAEVCPVRAVDRTPVGDGRRGPVTKAIQDAFFGIVQGTRPDKWGWLTPVV